MQRRNCHIKRILNVFIQLLQLVIDFNKSLNLSVNHEWKNGRMEGRREKIFHLLSIHNFKTCVFTFLFIGITLNGSLLAVESELVVDINQIPEPETGWKLVEELNLSGETLAELVASNSRLSGLKEFKARVYRIPDFEWDFDQVNRILKYYEDKLIEKDWKVMLRKFDEKRAILNFVLQEDGERKGLFILSLTANELTIIRLIGKFSITAIEELKSILQLGWRLEALQPLSRDMQEEGRRKTSPSTFRREHDITEQELRQKLFLQDKPEVKSLKHRFNIEELRQDISEGRATSQTYYQLGIAYERRGNYKFALDQYEVIFKQYPDVSDRILARVLYGKGRCSEQLGMINQAKESYVQFIEKFGTENSFEPAVEMGLIRLEKHGKTVNYEENQRAKSLYGMAENQIYSEWNLVKALDILNRIIAKYPKSAYTGSAQFMKSMAYYWLNKPEQHTLELEITVENYPTPVAYYYLGRTYHEQKMYKEAIEQFQTLLDKYPNSNHWHLAIADFNIAKCLEFLGQKDKAIERYEHFLDKYKNKEDYQPLYTSARIELEQLKRGKENMPFLGIGLQRIDSKVVVTKVIPLSPAQEAGIMKDDVILSVEGKEVSYPKDVIAAVVSKSVGDEIKLTVMRYGERLEMSAKLRAKSTILETSNRIETE